MYDVVPAHESIAQDPVVLASRYANEAVSTVLDNVVMRVYLEPEAAKQKPDRRQCLFAPIKEDGGHIFTCVAHSVVISESIKQPFKVLIWHDQTRSSRVCKGNFTSELKDFLPAFALKLDAGD